MEKEEAVKKIGYLREAFLKDYRENIDRGEYDARDLRRLAEDDAYVCVFLTTVLTRGDITKATSAIDVCFKWRKTEGVNDIQYSTFPEMAHQAAMDTVCYHGEDKRGCPILYVALAKNIARTEEEMNMLKKFIIYKFEEHYRMNPRQKCVLLLDLIGASLTNVSLELARFVIACMTYYYPAYLAYMINYQMPFILTATWKVISAFLGTEQKKYLKFIKGRDILNYIDEENLYPHMIETYRK